MNILDELINNCRKNKYYTGLIVVKNKEDVDKIDIKCDKIKYDKTWGLFIKYCYFKNGSFIMIYCCEDLEGVRMIRSNYLMIENGINKEFIEQVLLCYLVPYYHYMDSGYMYDMSYDKPVVKYFDINYSIEELKQICENNPYFVGLIITNLKRNKIKQLRFENGSILTSCYYKNPEINELVKVYNNRVLIDKNIDFSLKLNVCNYTLCDSCNEYLCGECRECKRDKDKVLIKGEIIKY